MVFGGLGVFLTIMLSATSSFASDGARQLPLVAPGDACHGQFLSRLKGPEFFSPPWFAFADNYVRQRATSLPEIREEFSSLVHDPSVTLWQVNLLLYRLLELSPYQGGESVSLNHVIVAGARYKAELVSQIHAFRDQLFEHFLKERKSTAREPGRRARMELNVYSPFVYGQSVGLKGEKRSVDVLGLARLAVGTTRRSEEGVLTYTGGVTFTHGDLLALIVNLKMQPDVGEAAEVAMLIEGLKSRLALGPAVSILDLADYRAPADFPLTVIQGSAARADEQSLSTP